MVGMFDGSQSCVWIEKKNNWHVFGKKNETIITNHREFSIFAKAKINAIQSIFFYGICVLAWDPGWWWELIKYKYVWKQSQKWQKKQRKSAIVFTKLANGAS